MFEAGHPFLSKIQSLSLNYNVLLVSYRGIKILKMDIKIYDL